MVRKSSVKEARDKGVRGRSELAIRTNRHCVFCVTMATSYLLLLCRNRSSECSRWI
jgi:hypothetical protein